MEQELNRKTMVIGHRNPDTDSICSAICYANLKQAVTGEEYMPARAGHVNGETQFVLDYFGAEEPPSAFVVVQSVMMMPAKPHSFLAAVVHRS